MAHQIYLTEGIILKKKDYGEADRLLWIYTEKFGMIMASAKGVRLEKSKLRYGLELFSLGNFAVISSGEFWQIVDARDDRLASGELMLGCFAKMSGILLRMIKGQEKNDIVWQELKNFYRSLCRSEVSPAEAKDLEISTMANVLLGLGYIARKPESKREAISTINRAIKESML